MDDPGWDCWRSSARAGNQVRPDDRVHAEAPADLVGLTVAGGAVYVCAVVVGDLVGRLVTQRRLTALTALLGLSRGLREWCWPRDRR
jgi:hypothetical protein